MTVRQMGISISVGKEDIKEFIGTKAEQDDVITITLAAGSSYWATDEKKGYIWDGDVWQALT